MMTQKSGAKKTNAVSAKLKSKRRLTNLRARHLRVGMARALMRSEPSLLNVGLLEFATVKRGTLAGSNTPMDTVAFMAQNS